MSSVEERKKDRYKKMIETILMMNPAVFVTKAASKAKDLLEGTLTKEKEFNIQEIIDDVKAEIEQEKARASAKAGKGVTKPKLEKGVMANIKPKLASIKEKESAGMTQQEMRMAKGGMVKKKKNKLAGRLAMRGYGIARK